VTFTVETHHHILPSAACAITAHGTAARGRTAARGQSRPGRGGPSLPFLLAGT
jgi:hypothetical protein